MTRALTIDFAREPGRGSLAGALLLVVGLLLVGEVGRQFYLGSRESARLEAQVDQLKRGSQRRVSLRSGEPVTDPLVAIQDARAANALIGQLNLPWDRLFGELEAAAIPNVALTAIQPDVKSRQLRLTGEAKDLASILAYAERLNKTRVLAATVLASHEFKVSDAQRVVAFSVVGNWKDTP